MLLPAAIVVGGAVITLSLSPSLIFGWGPMPALGIAGAAVAQLCYYGLGTLVLLGYLVSGRGLVRLSPASFRPRRRFFADILSVGAPGSLNTVLTNVTVIALTGLVGIFGTAALAGYGLGARLEYLQIPIVFGFGSALVAMVGTNVGAGRLARAERIAWTGAAMAAGVTEAIGLTAALFPGAWLGLFTRDPDVLAVGTTYLHTVGPVYGFFGLGLALYFASQGAGRLLWPLVAGFLRVSLAAVGGWLVTRWLGGGPSALFAVIALALVCFGTTVTIAVRAGAWRRD
jgi:Na+-driven multidrug efflux pump